MDAPKLMDDYYLNLLDWSANNILSIALTVNDDACQITSVKWAPDARHIDVGLINSVVQLWDFASNR